MLSFSFLFAADIHKNVVTEGQLKVGSTILLIKAYMKKDS